MNPTIVIGVIDDARLGSATLPNMLCKAIKQVGRQAEVVALPEIVVANDSKIIVCLIDDEKGVERLRQSVRDPQFLHFLNTADPRLTERIVPSDWKTIEFNTLSELQVQLAKIAEAFEPKVTA